MTLKRYIQERGVQVNENILNALVSRSEKSRVKTNTHMPCRVSGWRVVEDQLGRIIVLQPGIELEPINPNQEPAKEQSFQFPMESHLRDFIAKNIESIQINGHGLRLYQDQQGKTGIEYATGVGIIDILAEDECGNLLFLN